MYIRVNQSLIQTFSNNILHTFPCKWHGQRNSCIFVSLATRSVRYLWAAWFFCCWKNHFWDVSYFKIFSPLIERITFMRQRIKNFLVSKGDVLHFGLEWLFGLSFYRELRYISVIWHLLFLFLLCGWQKHTQNISPKANVIFQL